jgi:hypothetical protein
MSGLILLMLLGLFAFAAAIGGVVMTIKNVSNKKTAQPFLGPGISPVTAPGWYPDPADPNLCRYFDGRVWTSSTQPRG